MTWQRTPSAQRDEWHRNSNRRQQARKTLGRSTTWPTPCARCGRTLHPFDDWHLGHIKDRRLHPDLIWEPTNWQVECADCSRRAGAQLGAALSHGTITAPTAPATPYGFLTAPLHSKRPTLATFVSGIGAESRHIPETLSESPREPGDSDGLPLVFSPPHPDAVASRGDEMVAWAEARRGGPLRWFQWVTAQRRYETRADGSWCWQLVFESTPRQQGKSVTLAEDASWSCAQLGIDLVLHAAHRVRTSLKVQAELWHWAESRGLGVRRLLGDSQIIWPGATWATVAMESAYGQRPGRVLLDEAWAVDPVKFWNALFPSLGDRPNPQALFWSTANPDDRGMVADLRSDQSVCQMLWGAAADEDQHDERVWRLASAYWGPGRLELMRTAAKRPGFAEQWLNVWPQAAEAGGVPLVEADAWDALAGPRPGGGPVVVAVDSWPGDGLVVAGAWRAGDRVWVEVVRPGDLAAVVAVVRGWAAPRVMVGKEHAGLGVWSGLVVEPLTLASAPAAFGLAGLVGQGLLVHDGGEVLGGQLLAARRARTDGVNGPRLLPGGPMQAVRAAWAACRAALEPQQQGWFSAGGGRA